MFTRKRKNVIRLPGSVLIAALTLFLLGGCARDLMQVKFSPLVDHEIIPLEKTHPFLIVKCRVGGVERSWIVDSAASRTFIDREYATVLNLKHLSEAKGRDFNGEFTVTEVAPVPIQVGSLTLRSRSFLTMNMAPISKIAGQNIAGILGLDFLNGVIAELDLVESTATFYDPQKTHLNLLPEVTSGYAHRRYAAFRGTIDRNIEVRWIVDTGSTRSTLHHNLVRRYPELLRGKTGTVTSQAANSKSRLSLAKVPSLQLGGRTYGEVEVEVADVETGSLVFINEDVDGLLGLDLLRDFRVYFDFKNKTFALLNKDSGNTASLVEPRL